MESFSETDLSRNKDEDIMLGYFLSKVGTPYYVRFVRSSPEGRTRTKRISIGYDDDDDDDDENEFNILGCSNGFLLCYKVDQGYFISNPISKQRIDLPPLPDAEPLQRYERTRNPLTHGFQYFIKSSSSMNNYYEYKLVRAKGDDTCRSNILDVDLLSTTTPIWTHMRLNSRVSFRLNAYEQGTVITDHCFYWLAELDSKTTAILIYDERKTNSDLEVLYTPSVGFRSVLEKTGRDDILYASYAPSITMLRVWTLKEEDQFMDSHLTTRREWRLLYQVQFEITKQRWPDVLEGCPSRNHPDATCFRFHPLNPRILFLNIQGSLFLFDTAKQSLEFVSYHEAGGFVVDFTYYPYTCPLIGAQEFLP